MRKPVFGVSECRNRVVQPQKMTRGLDFRILEVEGMYYLHVAKTPDPRMQNAGFVTTRLKYPFDLCDSNMYCPLLLRVCACVCACVRACVNVFRSLFGSMSF